MNIIRQQREIIIKENHTAQPKRNEMKGGGIRPQKFLKMVTEITAIWISCQK